jgi:hypothetical protein
LGVKMGFSIYYEAKRLKQITEQEKTACQDIVERYCDKYPFKRKIEDFVVYDLDSETNIIFSGSTKLPNSPLQFMFDVANYWLGCLTEITNVLIDCQWDANFDDVTLVLDEKDGWRFPTDEEYHAAVKAVLGGGSACGRTAVGCPTYTPPTGATANDATPPTVPPIPGVPTPTLPTLPGVHEARVLVAGGGQEVLPGVAEQVRRIMGGEASLEPTEEELHLSFEGLFPPLVHSRQGSNNAGEWGGRRGWRDSRHLRDALRAHRISARCV